MDTPRTGRPRGRPRKEVEAKPRRARGRPRQPLAQNPKRYALAVFEAALRRGAAYGISELRVAETLVASAFGAVVRTPENLAELTNGRPFRVWMPSFRLDEQNVGVNWRHGNAFRPWADDLRRKLRRLRCSGNEDAKWLEAMSKSWQICLDGTIERLEEAQRLAESVGEREYFQKYWRPILEECFERRRTTGATA
jgi:hypothetical protein